MKCALFDKRQDKQLFIRNVYYINFTGSTSLFSNTLTTERTSIILVCAAPVSISPLRELHSGLFLKKVAISKVKGKSKFCISTKFNRFISVDPQAFSPSPQNSVSFGKNLFYGNRNHITEAVSTGVKVF